MPTAYDFFLAHVGLLCLIVAGLAFFCGVGAFLERVMGAIASAQGAREIDRASQAHRRLMSGSVRRERT